MVRKLALAAVVVVDFVKQLTVEVAPALKGKTVAIHTREDVAGNHGCLNEEGTRATHRIYEVALSAPAGHKYDSGSQHLVDGCLGLRHAVATLVQRLARTVERERNLVARDVHIEHKVGIREANRRATLILLHEVIHNSVLHAISDEFRVTEVRSKHSGIDGEGAVGGHHLVPVEFLHSLIELVGIVGVEFIEWLENAQCRAATEVGTIEHSLVTLKRNHAASGFHIFSPNGFQLVGKHIFQPLERLGDHFKLVIHHS